MPIRIDESKEMDGASRRTFRKLSKTADTEARTISGRRLSDNGAMNISQRPNSLAGIATIQGVRTIDRWATAINALGTWTQSQEADGPPGFTTSFKMLCTTADAAPAAGDFLIIYQPIEGRALQRLEKGTSRSKSVVLSFWAKSNVTGNYMVGILDNTNTRLCSVRYTINVSGVWEYKTIVFPPDTSGTLPNTNALSFQLEFWLDAGTDFTSGSPQTAWAANVNTNRAAGNAHVGAAVNNYWQFTAAQLEIGTTPTDFEFRPYGDEFNTCLRYFERIDSTANATTWFGSGFCYVATNAVVTVPFRITKRAAPVVTYSAANTFQVYNAAGAPTVLTAIATHNAEPHQVGITATVAAGLVAGNGTILGANTVTTATIDVSAE